MSGNWPDNTGGIPTPPKRKPITLGDLKRIIEHCSQDGKNDHWEVCIPNQKGGMGGTPTTAITSAWLGQDWNRGKFILWPEHKMMECPPRVDGK